jgi:hypothetical protein
MRKKEEFLRAFEPILAEATQTAYKGSPADTQNKIRRVVEVWRQRQIFSPPTQQEVEKRINGMHGHVWSTGVMLTSTEVDTSRAPRKQALGGSLFSASSIPPELAQVAPLATSLQKAELNTKPAVGAANQDYEKHTAPGNPMPSPPMHAAGLAALVKKLAVAEGAVAESIKARQALVAGLEKLLEENKIRSRKPFSRVSPQQKPTRSQPPLLCPPRRHLPSPKNDPKLRNLPHHPWNHSRLLALHRRNQSKSQTKSPTLAMISCPNLSLTPSSPRLRPHLLDTPPSRPTRPPSASRITWLQRIS